MADHIYKTPYDYQNPINIPESATFLSYAPNSVEETTSDPLKILSNALENPIGSPKIDQLIKSDDKILILVDDISRPTPIYKIIPLVLKQLKLKNVLDENITILIALGTHRPMTGEEKIKKYGKDIVDTYKILDHEWKNLEQLYKYGELEDGTQVVLNKAMHESDFVISIGSITPHPSCGFSGGGKMISPGVATDEAAGEFHWRSVQVPEKDVLGIRDNPMRKMIDDVAKLSGLSYIVNVILDMHENIVGCVAGDYIEAHKKGTEISLGVYGVDMSDAVDADIYIVDTHPIDIDVWQSVKAWCCIDTFIPDDKFVIVISGARDGIAPTHPEVLGIGYQELDVITPLVEKGDVSKIVGHNLVQVGRVLHRSKGFLVTPTVSSEDAKKLGYVDGFYQPQDALDEALKITGPNAKVVYITSAGEITPIIK